MVDATKVPTLGEFSQRYHSWVGGMCPNHYINEKDFDQDNFVQSQMATEIKVAMLTTQEYNEGLSPFKIIAAQPQSTNELAYDYIGMILNSLEDIPNVHCVSMAFDRLATDSEFRNI